MWLLNAIMIVIFGVSCAHKEVANKETKANSGKDGVPFAPKKDFRLEKHGDVRIDPYYWLRERENPEVVSYLKSENNYFDQFMKPRSQLKSKIFEELKSKIKEDQTSAPYRYKDYFYYTRFEKGLQYPIYARKFKDLKAKEEVILDVNVLARGFNFFKLTSVSISPDQKILAYAFDTVGRRFFTIAFKELGSGRTLPDQIKDVTEYFEWALDSKTVFFSKQDPKTLRSDRIFRFTLGDKEPSLVFTERDETFSVYPYRSITENFVYLLSSSTLTSEILYLPANQPDSKPKVFLKRKREHEYTVIDGHDGFYIISNENAKNRKLYRTPLDKVEKEYWIEILPHRKNIYLSDIQVFKDYIAIIERDKGLETMRILEKKTGKSLPVLFPDQAYAVSLIQNFDYQAKAVRYSYQSPRQPDSVYDFNITEKNSTLIKTEEVPNYDKDLYRVERTWIKVRDGEKVPVTLLMKKELARDGKNPILIYGYGSYGYSMSPYFSPNIFSLVDRGFIYAVAHIRGGGELGRRWFDEGRTLKKNNTFYDFVDVTEGLIEAKWADPRRVYAKGRSAGGLLMGAVMNLRPELYNGIIAGVPFVDVLTTMLDPSIPLTTGEYDEWGDPNVKKYYDYIKSYSPYDNVREKAYPNLLVTTGFHDSQVQYWEPAKWVAKLRESHTNKPLILLHTNFESGHSGKTGRFNTLDETAEEFTFLLSIDSETKISER